MRELSHEDEDEKLRKEIKRWHSMFDRTAELCPCERFGNNGHGHFMRCPYPPGSRFREQWIAAMRTLVDMAEIEHWAADGHRHPLVRRILWAVQSEIRKRRSSVAIRRGDDQKRAISAVVSGGGQGSRPNAQARAAASGEK